MASQATSAEHFDAGGRRLAFRLPAKNPARFTTRLLLVATPLYVGIAAQLIGYWALA